MSEEPQAMDLPGGDDPLKISFDFIKSNLFRVIHADGAWGGITPQGKIDLSIYSERVAIPQKVVHAVNPDGSLGGEIRTERVTRDAIVRELEVEIIMDVSTAQALCAWLQQKISDFETMLRQTSPDENQP
jgi:hypothetical protein